MRAGVKCKKPSLPRIYVLVFMELLYCVLLVDSRGAPHTEEPAGPTDDPGTVKAEVTDSRVLDRRQVITLRLNFGSLASKTVCHWSSLSKDGLLNILILVIYFYII